MKTQFTGRSADEFEILIISLREEGQDRDRRAQAQWLKTHSSRSASALRLNLPVEAGTVAWLEDIARDLWIWGDPYAYGTDKAFRSRAFRRVAVEILNALTAFDGQDRWSLRRWPRVGA